MRVSPKHRRSLNTRFEAQASQHLGANLIHRRLPPTRYLVLTIRQRLTAQFIGAKGKAEGKVIDVNDDDADTRNNDGMDGKRKDKESVGQAKSTKTKGRGRDGSDNTIKIRSPRQKNDTWTVQTPDNQGSVSARHTKPPIER